MRVWGFHLDSLLARSLSRLALMDGGSYGPLTTAYGRCTPHLRPCCRGRLQLPLSSGRQRSLTARVLMRSPAGRPGAAPGHEVTRAMMCRACR